MLQFIKDKSAVELLSLDTLNEEERTAYLEDMAYSVIAQAVARFLENQEIDQATRDALTNEMSREDIEANKDFFTQILQKFPKLNDYVAQEEYVFKKLSIVEQIRSVIDLIQKSGSDELKEYLPIVEELASGIEGEDSTKLKDLEEGLSEFILLYKDLAGKQQPAQVNN